MAQYLVHLLQELKQYIETVPEGKRPPAAFLLAEGIKLANQELNAFHHVADAGAWSIATAITLQRHSWLRASTLPLDIRTRLEDLPFEDKSLFSDQTDEILEKRKKYKLQAKTLGVTSQQPMTYKQRYFPHHDSQPSWGRSYRCQSSWPSTRHAP